MSLRETDIKSERATRHSIAFCLLLIAGFAGEWNGMAASVSTNFDGLVYTLEMPRTNVVAFEEIQAFIGISNAVAGERWAELSSPGTCKTAFGELLITNNEQGLAVSCAVPPPFRHFGSTGGMGILTRDEHHTAEVIPNLTLGYSLTNPGVYTVRAVGSFHYNNDPNFNRRFTITTPALFLHISKGTPTNPVIWPEIWKVWTTNQVPVSKNRSGTN